MVRLRPNSTECGNRISAAPAHRAPGHPYPANCRRLAVPVRLGEVQIYRVIAIAQRRPDHCAARPSMSSMTKGRDNRPGCEIAAKIGFRIGHENWRVNTAIMENQERFVVGQKLGKQGDREQNAKQP